MLLALALRARRGEQLARIGAMLEALAAAQDRLSRLQDDRMRDQERALATRLDAAADRTQATAAAIQQRLSVIDAARSNIEALGGQVTSLAAVLGNKQARGALGEVQLRDLVADRLPAAGYAWQHTLSNGTRCDCLIRLPFPPGPIVVDSKFPLEAWAAMQDAADAGARTLATRRFTQDIRRHVADIAGKYLIPGETAEGALMFLPSEAVHATLHAAHGDLVAEAARRGVHIVGPSSLWAVLNTMRALMRRRGCGGGAAHPARVEKQARKPRGWCAASPRCAGTPAWPGIARDRDSRRESPPRRGDPRARHPGRPEGGGMSLAAVRAHRSAGVRSAWALGGFAAGGWRVVGGLGCRCCWPPLLLNIPPLRARLRVIGDRRVPLAASARHDASLRLSRRRPLPFAEPFPGAAFILFFQGLPLVLVVGALAAVLYHWRVVPVVVQVLARLLARAFGLGGAAGFATAANVFVGMVEAPLLIRPWLARLSRSELFVVMTAGLATVSGNTLVLYAVVIAPVVPDAAGQLLTASLISAPAAVLVALLMRPRAEGDAAPLAEAATAAPRLYDSTMEALVRGTGDGLTLLLGIMASLIVFVALAGLVNMALEPLTGLTLQRIAAWLFWPLAFAMGIPAEHAGVVAASLGTKVVVNEFVAFLELAQSGGLGLSERSRLILTYALCGFTNFGSVGIMLGGMVAMCPERRADIVKLGLPALVSASIACCMTGAVVGVLTPP
jgi:CNT family concentrative nucleoside transporter